MLSSQETAARLGVKVETLYAYVSRGLISPVARHGGQGSWFDPRDVEDLAARTRRRRRDQTLEVHSAITLIDAGTYYYRGRPALDLADRSTFLEVASLLWGEPAGDARRWRPDADWVAMARAAARLASWQSPAHDRLRLMAAAVGCGDPLAGDNRPATVTSAAGRLLASLVAALGREDGDGLAPSLWTAVSDGDPSPGQLRLLEQVLSVVADHGLAPSTMAARLAAAHGAGIHAALGAALGAFSGDRHGSATLATEGLLTASRTAGASAALAGQVRDGRPVPGVGHPLYPDGDPRAVYLLTRLREESTAERMAPVDDLVALLADRGFPPPNLDMALGALTVAMGWRPGSGELLFAVGRMAGWVAHMLEAAAERPTRLRAVYTGRPPSR